MDSSDTGYFKKQKYPASDHQLKINVSTQCEASDNRAGSDLNAVGGWSEIIAIHSFYAFRVQRGVVVAHQIQQISARQINSQTQTCAAGKVRTQCVANCHVSQRDVRSILNLRV